MVKITEDYVSFEIAKLLKEKGFDEECNKVIHQDTRNEYYFGNYTDDIKGRLLLVPTLQMAMKWLREVHKIYIMIDRSWSMEDSYQYCICVNDDFVHLIHQDSVPNSYEQAVDAAIKYCLENLV